jgi:hypothetical protein
VTELPYLTVRSHMQNLLPKLGVHSQLEAVAFAVEHGVVEAWGRRSGNALVPSNSESSPSGRVIGR